ncbi:MAG: putative toxin-antitoxin system toxin component, PIN family [Catonella sp.]|nr:putative toxin-antitoxin system toxin component, PIN family [Catonella sp.]MDY6355789.1 putative toxin-antitoxin system toxin component, PIN family [Catonella sp.]
MRIVIDTNVIASAVYFGGKPEELLELLFKHRIDAYVTPDIIQEYQATVMELKERYPYKKARTDLSYIISTCKIINPISDEKVSRDPDDDKFINCAIDANCVFITTGDKDLLSIREYKNIKIVTVAEFLDEFYKH